MTSQHRFYHRHTFVLFSAIFGVSFMTIIAFNAYYHVRDYRLADMLMEEAVRMQTIGMMNKMREQGIVSLPLTPEQDKWLHQSSDILGYSLAFEDGQGRVWRNEATLQSGKEIRIPYIAQGELMGYVTATLGKNAGSSTVDKQQRIYQWVGGLILLLLAIVSGVIARRLSQPIVALSYKTEHIAQGDRTPDVNTSGGSKELQQMAQTINALVSELNTHELLRQTLMQDLAHELRTPLTSMLTIIEAMIDGVYPVDDAKLTEIYEEMERLSRLVMDMVELSEAEGSRFSLKIERCDMARLLKGVYHNFIPNAKSKGIKLIFEPPTIPCYAEVDNDRVIQMVYNLLSNAIKHTDPYGKVILSLYSTDDEVIIRCQDFGVGIAEEQLPFIFNRLYRIDKSRSRVSGGLGVGLSITKALVEAHFGTISVDSKVDEGSTFTIKLPKEYKLN